ncbi:MAG: flavin reductase family protein [Nitrososphaerota archaeon]|jgi:flavin reductase (DIM6/NTAB) family NADH-FMN oxidoreductase RutF|nr:flavin reductase family protein [Nitrososphaerota archaeon]MDG6921871.1 flavin reductase family protein [Nitrososphaerota archaeon]
MSDPIKPRPPLKVDIRNIMRHFASHVTVVTGALNTGELFGLTITAFTSVSLDPPLVLFCVRNESSATDLFKKSGRFCVNILAEGQRAVGEKFSLTGEASRFADLDYCIGKGGSPIIRGCLGYIDCKITHDLLEGDHTIFFGEAIDVQGEEKRPLLYLNRNYAGLNL